MKKIKITILSVILALATSCSKETVKDANVNAQAGSVNKNIVSFGVGPVEQTILKNIIGRGKVIASKDLRDSKVENILWTIPESAGAGYINDPSILQTNGLPECLDQFGNISTICTANSIRTAVDYSGVTDDKDKTITFSGDVDGVHVSFTKPYADLIPDDPTPPENPGVPSIDIDVSKLSPLFRPAEGTFGNTGIELNYKSSDIATISCKPGMYMPFAENDFIKANIGPNTTVAEDYEMKTKGTTFDYSSADVIVDTATGGITLQGTKGTDTAVTAAINSRIEIGQPGSTSALTIFCVDKSTSASLVKRG